MIGRLNHVAIATNDIKKAAKIYRDTLGGKVSEEVAQPDHGVTTVFVDLGNTKIELLEPLGENSPIANFLKKNPNGGMHHVCYEVQDIYAARDKMKAQGATITGPATAGLSGLASRSRLRQNHGCTADCRGALVVPLSLPARRA